MSENNLVGSVGTEMLELLKSDIGSYLKDAGNDGEEYIQSAARRCEQLMVEYVNGTVTKAELKLLLQGEERTLKQFAVHSEARVKSRANNLLNKVIGVMFKTLTTALACV